MKVVILAGGYGTRLSEETVNIPKPMIEIGGKPILWHIMKEYSYYGFNEFIICLGYKGNVVKNYFSNYFLNNSDVTFDFVNNETIYHKTETEPWKVTLIDTGLDTMTGGRIKRIKDYLIKDDEFLLTYGDGVCDVNIKDVVKYHKSQKAIATITAIKPGGKFGALTLNNNNQITSFIEKSRDDGGWINGGYMVLNKKIFDYLVSDSTILEKTPLETLAKEGKLFAYKYDGFWQCMDTLKDKNYLERLIETNNAPWKVWEK
jgi:glucose-1-phosphate cytidylyltransferase